MREKLRFLGLDVHAETIAVAVAEPKGEVRSLGTIANREDSIRKFIKKLGSPEQLRACYEAGPTGFVLYWQLTQLGVDCTVVAPSLVPRKPGDRVKTDRRDALELARCHRNGDLTAVWVPDEASEALRDLVRQREAAKQDQLRARHRLTKLLLRTGQRPPLGLKPWTERYWRWLGQVRYAQPAQEITREPSAYICDRLSRTRVSSQRQLPTDHDYAVPTREYQLDQSSPLPATAAADPVLDRKKRPAHLDRSLHINVRIAGNTDRMASLGRVRPTVGGRRSSFRLAGHTSKSW